MTTFLVISGAILWIMIGAFFGAFSGSLAWAFILAVIAEVRCARKFRHRFNWASARFMFWHGTTSLTQNGWKVPAYPWQSWADANPIEEDGE